MSEQPLLQVHNLKTYFYTEDGVMPSVDGVDFDLHEGETLAIVGESGCGKSVTSLSIMGLVQCPPGKIEAGEILYHGKDLLKISKKEMRSIRGNEISMIFQEPMTSLNPVFTVGRQIMESFIIHQKLNKKEARTKAIEMIRMVGIPDPEKVVDKYPHELSGGMRQRIMIAMALACKPRILIADEPTTALDVTIQAQIMQLLKDLKEKTGTSIIIITHDLGVVAQIAQTAMVILLYSRSSVYRFPQQTRKLDITKPGTWNNHWRGTDRPTMRYPLFGRTPSSGQWRWSKERSDIAVKNYEKLIRDVGTDSPTNEQIESWYSQQKEKVDLLRLSENGKPEHYIPATSDTLLNSSWMDLLVGSSSEINNLFESKVFDTAKLTALIIRMLKFCDKDSIILDFFSGSATTAHAVMQLNAEDGGHRKFIMVQLPEATDEKSEAYKAGYQNICEIGKERIRRAGTKINNENEKLKDVPLIKDNKDAQLFLSIAKNGHDAIERTKSAFERVDISHSLDTGFRVLKCDTSNMKDVYYNPAEYEVNMFSRLEDNIKEDRTPEDLLFQVMLDLGVLLSSKIEETTIAGKKVFNVEDNYLIACFDSDVSEETIKAIAKQKPYYFVMRDSSMASDSVATNFDQIFATYSPDTVRKVL